MFYLFSPRGETEIPSQRGAGGRKLLAEYISSFWWFRRNVEVVRIDLDVVGLEPIDVLEAATAFANVGGL